jgi:NTE family protein
VVPNVWHVSFIAARAESRDTRRMTAQPGQEPVCKRASASRRETRRIASVGDPAGIALALGGGFSRGFAHLGVLEVLEQEQIPVSLIVGTSIGGLLGAAWADGISVRDLCDLGRRVRVRDFLRFHRVDRNAPIQRRDHIGDFINEWFRAGKLEDLPVPTTIVATDLDSGAPYTFTRGPLEIAMRATCAFPGLVKPVKHEGHLLADGCIVSPVPTAIAARMHGGCILGVSVSSSTESSPSPEDAVKIFDSGYRSSHRPAHEPSWCRHADILLEPQVHGIDWSDFTRVDEALFAGAEAMRAALPHLRSLLARRPHSALPPGEFPSAARGLAL